MLPESCFWIIVGILCTMEMHQVQGGDPRTRDERGKLVVNNREECKCPKGDETEWRNKQHFYCGSQINAAKCDLNVVYSCEGKKPGDDPQIVANCNEECRLNNVSPVVYCSVEYAVPKRIKYTGDISTLKEPPKILI